MGRKRNFGHADSSDDDFQPSGGEEAASPVVSRLKRKKRSSTRGQHSSSLHPSRDTSPSIVDVDDNCNYICIPDSLEHDNDRPIPETPVKVSSTPRRDDQGKSASPELQPEPEGPEERVVSLSSGEEDAATERVPVAKPMSAVAEDSSEAPEESEEEEPNTSPPRRKVPPIDRSSFQESDSDSAPEPSDDDEEAYNSEDDEPDDEDVSDFAPSPVKPSRKRKQKEEVKPRAAAIKPKKGAALKRPKPQVKGTKKVAKSMPAVTNRTTMAKLGSGAKRLGVRMPSKLPSLGTPSKSTPQRKVSSSAGRVGTNVFRAGLSRKASIPRLHSYLP